MKKRFIVGIIIGAVVIFAVGCSVGASSANAGIRSNVNQGAKAQDNGNHNQDSQNSQDKQIQVIQMGTEANIENADMKVVNVTTKQSVSDELGTETATGKFIVIELSMKNTSSTPIQYGNYEFALVSNGKVYESGDNASEAATSLNSKETIDNNNSSFIGKYNSFNPDITKKSYIVFDVPKDFDINGACLAVGSNQNIAFKLAK